MIFFVVVVNIGSSLASKIQSTGTDFKKYLPDASVKSLFFTPTNEHEICQIVNTFKGCKAPGIDEFSPKVVKSVIDLISVPLSCIFNLSMCEGVFPEKLKLAKVSPVFKKGNKSDMNNYRPISVLSVFSKILERIVYKRVYSFLEKNNILYGSQFGFRKGLSIIAEESTDIWASNIFNVTCGVHEKYLNISTQWMDIITLTSVKPSSTPQQMLALSAMVIWPQNKYVFV